MDASRRLGVGEAGDGDRTGMMGDLADGSDAVGDGGGSGIEISEDSCELVVVMGGESSVESRALARSSISSKLSGSAVFCSSAVFSFIFSRWFFFCIFFHSKTDFSNSCSVDSTFL